jgi:protein SCO1
MILLKSIAFALFCFMSVVSAQIIKDAVPGDFTPATPQKYFENVTNPSEKILSKSLPLDVIVRDDNGGTERPLGDFFKSEKPSILCMVYFGCRSTCGPLMNDVYTKIADLSLKVGNDYNLIFISMEPKEDASLAADKKAGFIDGFKYANNDGHHYLTASAESIKQITSALDFKYVAITETADYSHPTVTYFITPQGTISRFLTGFGFNTQDIKLSLLDAGNGKVGSLLDNALLLCYTFDPKNKTYVRNSMLLMSVAGAVTILFMAIFLGSMWYYEFKNKDKIKI